MNLFQILKNALFVMYNFLKYIKTTAKQNNNKIHLI